MQSNLFKLTLLIALGILIGTSNAQTSNESDDIDKADLYPARGVVPANCMWCKKLDSEAGFMYNYNFCSYNSTCYDDTWNLQNEWCRSGWKQGFSQRLEEDCKAKKVPCATFTSADTFAAVNITASPKLGEGEYCVFTVDATAFVGRLLFKANSGLGIMYSAY